MLASSYRRLATRVLHWNYRRAAARVLDRQLMQAIHRTNREALAQVPEWISDETWNSGVYGYGMPPDVRELIDLDVGEGCTYTDALLSLVPHLRRPVQYLEVGVSVGKNFFQVAGHVRDASLTGFDIEEINPVLASRFEMSDQRAWATMAKSLKKTHSSLTTFSQRDRSNRIEYLCGDVFDGASWAQLAGKQFNVVFSDAFHSPDALLMECGQLLEHDLLNPDEVIIMWDDLIGPMQDAFQESCRRLARQRPGCRHTSFLAPLKGWLGDNEPDHEVGFFLSSRARTGRSGA